MKAKGYMGKILRVDLAKRTFREEELSEKLGTNVSFVHNSKRGGGKLTIHYASLNQLDGILLRLR